MLPDLPSNELNATLAAVRVLARSPRAAVSVFARLIAQLDEALADVPTALFVCLLALELAIVAACVLRALDDERPGLGTAFHDLAADLSEASEPSESSEPAGADVYEPGEPPDAERVALLEAAKREVYRRRRANWEAYLARTSAPGCTPASPA